MSHESELEPFTPISNSKQPSNDAFTQQMLPAIPPKEYVGVIQIAAVIVVLGIMFLPLGVTLLDKAENVYENTMTYDSTSVDYCKIYSRDEGRHCNLTFTFDQTVQSPVYLYYQLESFYQNHQRYVQSRSIKQLQGVNLGQNDVTLNCDPLYLNGSQLLNPCGLIANSFFNDVFKLNDTGSSSAIALDESNVALKSDIDNLFLQVDGFNYVSLSHTEYLDICSETLSVPINGTSCSVNGLEDGCKCYAGKEGDGYDAYLFYYPNDDTVQYLYETYPNQISPIEGVTDQHFIVWMRTASLPTFRKLYGVLSTEDGSDFKNGDQITIDITANFEVQSFNGYKGLLISDLGPFGGKNIVPGQAYITVGALSMVLGVILISMPLYKKIKAM